MTNCRFRLTSVSPLWRRRFCGSLLFAVGFLFYLTPVMAQTRYYGSASNGNIRRYNPGMVYSTNSAHPGAYRTQWHNSGGNYGDGVPPDEVEYIPEHETLEVDGRTLYFYKGAFYRQSTPEPGLRPRYAKVIPPVGAVVQVLPPNEPIPFQGILFYHAEGVFYREVDQGFGVTEPPAGISVTNLPSAQITSINAGGKTYFRCYETYYQRFYGPAGITYQVIAPPFKK